MCVRHVYQATLSKSVTDRRTLKLIRSYLILLIYTQTFIKKLNAVTICPGPNIANFSKVVSLQTITDHIYGRTNILTQPNRPHMFIKELHLYIDYLKEQLEDDIHTDQFSKKKKYYASFYQNLSDGIMYYRRLPGISATNRNQFVKALYYAETELDFLNYHYSINENQEQTIGEKPAPQMGVNLSVSITV